MPRLSRRLEQFLKDGQRLQLRETGQVKAVVFADDMEAAVSFHAVHAEQVHGPVVGFHQLVEHLAFLGREKDSVSGLFRYEAGIHQVEPATFAEVVQVRINPQKAGQFHQKDQVEIGEFRLAGIEPLDGVGEVGE